MNLTQLRRDLARWVSPDLAKDEAYGSYLHIHVTESLYALGAIRPVRRALERILNAVAQEFHPIDMTKVLDYEPDLGRFRDDLISEQRAVLLDPDPTLERLYAEAVVRCHALEERVKALLVSNTETLNMYRALKKLPPVEPFDGFKDCSFPDGQSFSQWFRERKAANYHGA
jgi:hypothetical protein